MSSNEPYVLVFKSFVDAGQELDESDRKDFYTAVLEHLRYKKEPENLEGAAKALYIAVKPVMDKHLLERESGKKGGKVSAEKRKGDTQGGSQDPCAETAQGSVVPNRKRNRSIEKDTSKDVSKKKFQKPTPEQVKSYATEKGCPDFDAEHFVDHYESNGWMVGKNHMKDWQSTVRNWIRRTEESKPKEVQDDHRFDAYRF